MFDFRYHVASLAAVFVALVIGILVGVGLSGQGFVTESEREKLENRIDDLSAAVEAQKRRADDLERSAAAAGDFTTDAYPVLAADRLKGKHVAVVVVGSADQSLLGDVSRAVGDAGGDIVRVRTLRVPVDLETVEETLKSRPALAGYVGEGHVGDLGRDVGRELVTGGQTPLLDALSSALVEERSGPSQPEADAAVVVRTAAPQQEQSGRFVNGLYSGLASAGMPAVGAETTDAEPTTAPTFARRGLSTVNNVDTPLGRLALVLLLAGGQPGSYGVRDADATLPPIEPLPPESQPGSGG
jgi:hypothetical protein